MKKFIAFLMCALLCVGTCGSLIACGGEEDEGTVTVIEYCIGDGGFGRAHADDIAAEFEKWAANKSYAEGKMGVRVDVNVESSTSISKAESQGYHVMNVSVQGTALSESVRQGYLAQVDDVVNSIFPGEERTIADKIPSYSLGAFQGDVDLDGQRHFYAVPGYSYSPGITFDENSFNRNGYFLAASPDEECSAFESAITGETYYFLDGTGHGNKEPEGKSVGPDQIAGTQDDGLPANMLEFVALCEKIKSDDRSPFIVAGAYPSYQQFLEQAIFAQLMGYQQLKTWSNFDGGELEIVVGYTNEPLFPGLDPAKGTIYKPVTKVINLTEENGYYATWAVARYYATAFVQLAFAEEWFHDNVYNTNHDQKSAMRDFMLSGFAPAIKESAMLIEMNFWYNEAKIGNIPQQYEAYYNDDGHEERRLTWMSLPTVFYGYTDQQLIDEQKTRQVLYETNANGLGIAAWVEKKNPEVFEACKDFLRFYASDYQMNRWTAEIGIRKTANYEITDETLEQLPWYAARLGELMNTNMDIFPIYAENETFKQNYQDYVMGYHSNPMDNTINGIVYSAFDYFKKLGSKGASTKVHFEADLLTPSSWAGKYYGDSTVADYLVDENGAQIKFNSTVPA